MKRTFWAVKISEEARQLIRQIYRDLPHLGANIRLVPPENVHVTLKFLGDTEEKMIPSIVASVQQEIESFPSFTYWCDGAGTFPNYKNPRIIYLGITEGLEKLREISNITERIMEGFGYTREKRAFTPHLTIGRVKNERKALNEVKSFLRYTFEPIACSVSEVILFESTLTPQGAIYTPLRVIELK